MNVEEAQALGDRLVKAAKKDKEPAPADLAQLLAGATVNLARIANALEQLALRP